MIDFILIRNKISKAADELKPKKRIVLAMIALVLIVAIIVGISSFNRNFFDRVAHKMLKEYGKASSCTRWAADGSTLEIDTNPNDYDIDSSLYNAIAAQDALEGIKFVNQELGFRNSVYTKMLSTTALMGRQTEENNKFIVTWSYHPDKGLEVMYEKK